jgi:mannose-1-phosphate guanylyltransferase
VFLDELGAADATLAAGVERTAEARAAGDEDAAAAAYSALPTVAVEPLIFERTPQLTCVRASFPWSDLGSWGDLHAARVAAGRADSDGNVVAGDVVVVESSDCTVESRGGRLVAIAGAQRLVVIDTPDAVLVVPQDQSQLVKQIVERLRAEGRSDLL